MTLAELRDWVTTYIGEGTGALDASLITEALNEAYVSLANETRVLSRSVSGSVVAGTRTLAIPRDSLGVTHLAVTIAGTTRAVGLVGESFLAGFYDDYLTGQGAPRYRYVINTLSQGLYPVPSGNGTYTLTQVCQPVAGPSAGMYGYLVNDTDAPALPESTHLLMALDAVARLCEGTLREDDFAAERASAARLDRERLQGVIG